ncbi:MAG: hypothetical protein ACHQRM_13750 [Bacteroidia bacterium]
MRFLLPFFLLILLSSCSRLGIERRLYRSGYYVEHSSGVKAEGRSKTVINKPVIAEVRTRNATNAKDVMTPQALIPVKQAIHTPLKREVSHTEKDYSVRSSLQKTKQDARTPSAYVKRLAYGAEGFGGFLWGLAALILFFLIVAALTTTFPAMSPYLVILFSTILTIAAEYLAYTLLT